MKKEENIESPSSMCFTYSFERMNEHMNELINMLNLKNRKQSFKKIKEKFKTGQLAY